MSASGWRILHLVAIRGKGGTGASTASLIEGLAKRGHRVWVGCFERSAIYKRLRDHPRVKVATGIYMSPLNRLPRLAKDLLKLARLVRNERVQLVHTHSSPDTWLGFFLSFLFPQIPLIRGRHVPVPLSANPFNGLVHHRSRAVVAVSHAVKEAYLSGKCWRDKVRVITDGVDTARFSPACNGQGFRKETGTEEGLLVVNMSRYAPVKGLPVFLEGIAPLLKRHANARAVVVGRKREQLLPQLEAHARVLGIEKRVLFMEYRDDTPQILSAADVVVLTSLSSEGSSRVSMEAHASGRPMVGTKVGAISEVVDHLHTGLVVPPYHPPALASALAPILSNMRLARCLGVRARRRALVFMEREKGVERTERLYQEVLDG